MGSVPKKLVDTKFSPALSSGEFMCFIRGGIGERRGKITMLKLNRSKTMTMAKQKTNLRNLRGLVSLAAPAEIADPSCEASQLLCR